MSYQNSANREHSVEKGKGYDLSSGETFGFTLGDEMMGNLYDVQIKRDPIYGTPVFETLGGRSACPHQANTDAREKFSLRYSRGINENEPEGQLDDVVQGSLDLYERDVAVHYDPDNGVECASFYVTVINDSPYGDTWEWYMLVDRGGSSSNPDMPGLMISVEGVSENMFSKIVLPPLTTDKKEEIYRINFCPFPDGRDIDAIRGNGTYRNIEIKMSSMCEEDMYLSDGLAKFSRWTDDTKEPPTCAPGKSECSDVIFEV